MGKKTLLQVRPKYPGLMTTCNSYLDAFDDLQFRKVVVFLTGKAEQEICAQIPADQVIFLELKKRQSKGFRVTAVRKLLKLCRENHVHLVLAHRYKPTYIMALVALFYPPQLILSVMHGLDPFKTLSRRFFGRLLLRKHFKFIGVSAAVRQTIIQSGIGVSPQDVLALPNCIDVETATDRLLSRPDARKFLALQNDDFVFGNIGRLSPRKDQTTLLRAFAQAKPHMPRAKLVIVGGGRLGDNLQDEALRLDLRKDIIFAGPVPDAYRVMPAFDVFALTSISEGFPRVLLEAMACKLPIIATDAGGIREIIGGITNLYLPGNVLQISKAFLGYYEMKEQDRVQIGEKLFDYLQATFSTTVFRRRLLGFVNAYS